MAAFSASNDDMSNVATTTEMDSDSINQVIENLQRTQLRLNILEHHLREINPEWAEVASNLAEEVASDASMLECLCQEDLSRG